MVLIGSLKFLKTKKETPSEHQVFLKPSAESAELTYSVVMHLFDKESLDGRLDRSLRADVPLIKRPIFPHRFV